VCHTSSADVEDGQAGCNVQVVALSELLDDLGITEEEVRDTHFWSIDVEGNELQVLRGVDFSRHRPRFVLIEVPPSYTQTNKQIIHQSNKYNKPVQ
jgi:hypothetical protein